MDVVSASCFSPYFCSLILASIGDSYLKQLLLQYLRVGDIFHFFHSSTFISWNSTIRNSLFSSTYQLIIYLLSISSCMNSQVLTLWIAIYYYLQKKLLLKKYLKEELLLKQRISLLTINTQGTGTSFVWQCAVVLLGCFLCSVRDLTPNP